jgi:hypothetical protein
MPDAGTDSIRAPSGHHVAHRGHAQSSIHGNAGTHACVAAPQRPCGYCGRGGHGLEGTAWSNRWLRHAARSGRLRIRAKTCSGRKVSSRRPQNADVLRDQERDHSTWHKSGGAAPAAGGRSQSNVPRIPPASGTALTSATHVSRHRTRQHHAQQGNDHPRHPHGVVPQAPTHGVTRDPDAQTPQPTIRNNTTGTSRMHGDGE